MTFLSKGLRPLPEKWHGLTDIEQKLAEATPELFEDERIVEEHVRVFGELMEHARA